MSEQAPHTRRDLEAQLTARAWKDQAFRQRLLDNPKSVVEEELARWQIEAGLPDALEIRVLEETPTTLYLVVPPKWRWNGPGSDFFYETTFEGYKRHLGRQTEPSSGR
jgi:hypothetical protein